MQPTSEKETHEQEVRKILDQPEYFKCIKFNDVKLRRDVCVKRRYLRQYNDVCGSCDQGLENENTFSEEELQTIVGSLMCKKCEKNQAEVKGFCKRCYNKQYIEQKKVNKDEGDTSALKLCECGCGQSIHIGRRFIQGHWNKKVRKVEKLDKEKTGVQTKVMEEVEKEMVRDAKKDKSIIEFDIDEDTDTTVSEVTFTKDTYYVDFTDYQHVHDVLTKVAKREVRSIENQIVYLVMKGLEGLLDKDAK